MAAQKPADALLARVDHLVFATPDLRLGVDTIERLLGVRATPGGQHPGLGTRNALVSLGPGRYLEIIGPDPDQPRPAGPRRFGLDDLKAPRLLTWVANGRDLDRLVADASRHDVKLGAVIPGSRQRPDGVRLTWRYTDPNVVLADRLIPYFIDWGSSPHPSATATRGAMLVELRAEHPDHARVQAIVDAVGLGLRVDSGPRPALIATINGTKGPVDLRSDEVLGQTSQTPPPTRAETIEDLVIANHVLSREGVLDGFGHVSVRDPRNPDRYLLARSVAPELVTAADVIEYDLESRAIDARGRASYRERFIHGEIYKSRPDVMAVVHCHTPSLIPFAASSVPLRPMYHQAAFVGQGVPTYDIRDESGMTNMLVEDAPRGRALARVLANKPAVLMRGHGAVVVASSIPDVVGRSVYLDVNAKAQAQAIALGGTIKYLDPEEARIYDSSSNYDRAWDLWKKKVQR